MTTSHHTFGAVNHAHRGGIGVRADIAGAAFGKRAAADAGVTVFSNVGTKPLRFVGATTSFRRKKLIKLNSTSYKLGQL